MKKYRAYLHRLKMSDFVRVFMDKPLLVPVAVLLKPFRLKCFEAYHFHHASAFNTPQELVPSDFITALNSKELLLGSLGYWRAGLDLYQPPNNEFTQLTSLLYSNAQQTMATIYICYFNNGWKPAEFQGFTTLVEDFQYVITSNVRGRLPIPNFIDGVSLPGRTMEELSEIHESRLSSAKRLWGNLTDLEVKEQHIRRLDRNYSYFNERGIYGPLESA